ncbi:MAG TPA: MerR family transcriptional regulator [Acidimicrobiales bacterium]|jgi:DNA-binding transcriptional MerR regulator
MSVTAEESEWPVEEVAARSGLPVRTIREYQTMRVLQPPVRRGRVSFYSDTHLRRLALIARLQDRGYSLAAMRDLFEAWAAGRDLAGVLVDPEGLFVDEAPLVLDRDGLEAALSHVPADRISELIALGVVIESGSERYGVPSPSLLSLVDDAVANGVGLEETLAVAGAIATGVRSIAEAVAATLGEALAERADDEGTVQLLRRGRVLVAEATSRLLLHELGLALTEPADHPVDARVSQLVDRVRLGRGTPPSHKARGRQPTRRSAHGE